NMNQWRNDDEHDYFEQRHSNAYARLRLYGLFCISENFMLYSIKYRISMNLIYGGKMNIRKMTLDDYDSIYELWMSCKGMGLNNLDDSKEGIERFIKRNPDTCFVAVIDDKIVGAIMVGSDGRRGYIYHTAVNLQYRRQG